MAALTLTSLAAAVSASATQVRLVDVSSIAKGDLLFADGEAMSVVAAPIGDTARVMRGVAGTTARAHLLDAYVVAGAPHRFHSTDPIGPPADFPLDNPWINLRTGQGWIAVGDEVGPHAGAGHWQPVTLVYPVGALGIRTPATIAT